MVFVELFDMTYKQIKQWKAKRSIVRTELFPLTKFDIWQLKG
jgi:hypothetical protein